MASNTRIVQYSGLLAIPDSRLLYLKIDNYVNKLYIDNN